MYLTFNKINKLVSRICEEEIVSCTEGFELARYYGEIPKNDYLTVTNLREETETFIEKKTVLKKIIEKVPQTRKKIIFEPIEVKDENGQVAIDESGNIIMVNVPKVIEETIEVDVEKEVEEEVEETKTRTFITCDLVANFYPPKTEEELAKEKDEQYGKLVETLIRKKYSSRDVEAIHSNYLEALNPDSDISEEKRKEYIAEFKAFQEYRLECKEIARAEIYK